MFRDFFNSLLAMNDRGIYARWRQGLMSAAGYKQTWEWSSRNVCFPPESRHERREFPGHPEDRAGESAYRSKADVGDGIALCLQMTQSGHSVV